MKANNIIHGDVSLAGILSSAEKIYYNNLESSLNSENVQGALNELDSSVRSLFERPSGGEAWNGLTKTDNSIGLGGILHKDTSINFNKKEISFYSSDEFNTGTGLYTNDPGPGYSDMVVFDSSNRILIGGYFASYDGSTANCIIRLNEDGTIDETFYPKAETGFDNEAQTLLIDSSNRILISGYFTTYDGSTANYIIRLNEDGTIDETFYSNMGTGFDAGGAYCMTIDSSNRILIGGDFTSYNGSTANYIIRLNEDGTIDETFYPKAETGFDNEAQTLLIDSSNRILISGYFTTYDGSTANYIIRLNEDGTIDETFYSNMGTGFDAGGAYCMTIDSSNRILIGGDFTSYNGSTANYIIRLNEDGTIDETFDSGAGFNSIVYSMIIDSNNKILVSGQFTIYDGSVANYIIRLNEDGTIDEAFDSGAGFNNTVYSMIIDSNNKILLGGYFTYYNDKSVGGIIKLNNNGSIYVGGEYEFILSNGLAKYKEDYSLVYDKRTLPDVAWVHSTIDACSMGSSSLLPIEASIVRIDASLNDTIDVYTILDASLSNIYAYQDIQDASINLALSGGSVEAWNGLTKTDSSIGIGGKLLIDSSINLNDNILSFNNIVETFIGTGLFEPDENLNTGTGFSLAVWLDIDSNNKILVGGAFTSYDGSTANYILKLNENGTIDEEFYTNMGTGFSDRVNVLNVNLDNKILLVGQFTSYDGSTANYILKLNENGTIDEEFYTNMGTGATGVIRSLTIDSSNRILIGGYFYEFNSTLSDKLIRLNENGTTDGSFNIGAGFDQVVMALTTDSSNKVLVGGFFNNFDGSTANYIIRLNEDGTRDESFNTGVGFNSYVNTLTVDSSNRILLGGAFTSYDGSTANYIIRLNEDGTRDESFNTGVGFDQMTTSICIDSSNKILVGGIFNSYNDSSANSMIRLNEDGTVFETFNSSLGLTGNVNYLTIDLNNRILLVGGAFSYYDSSSVSGIIRLKEEGIINTTIHSTNFKGNIIEYADDCSSTYTNRSLPDVAWVHSNFQTISMFDSPGSASDGLMGTFAYDASYLYVCTSTNTWGRILLETGY